MARANERNTKFSRELQRLNPAQREAVETIEGPLLVVAGPGTGKTQVVAMRIGQILQSTQLNARNVLALTFTEAGVTALQKRLERLIGPDAYQVTIATFHGFANEVISTFPYLFGSVSELTQVSELERLQIIHRILLEQEDLVALRPVRSPTFHVHAIATAIRVLKQENTVPDTLEELARDEYGQSQSEKETTAARASRLRQLELNLELARVFSAYREEMERRGLYDYEDMILFAIDALRTQAEVRAYYQERYQYIVVDEYQDTNNAQNALVEAVSDFFENPNMCVVGDDKQAIYRFQGASVANMLHFSKRYPSLRVANLRENYRSTAPILTSADQLIRNNKHQLSDVLTGISSELVPARTSTGKKPEVASFDTTLAEYDWIINQIQHQHKKGTPLEEMAVLFRKNTAVSNFREFAARRGLALAGTDATNLATEPVIQQILTLVRAVEQLENPRLVIPALRLIRPLSPIVLAQIAAVLRRTTDFESVMVELSLPEEIVAPLREALSELAKWAESRHNQSLMESLQQLVCESRILPMIESLPNALEQLELVKTLLSEARRFSLSQPQAGLSEFLDYFGLLRSYRLRLTVDRLIPREGGVFVGTVHAAKGLEFDTVFLADVSTKAWNDRGKRDLIRLPSAIVDAVSIRSEALEDERRLFYVGVTRAKNQLVCTYPRADESGREQLPCQFISEIADTVSDVRVITAADHIAKVVKTTFTQPATQALTDQELRLIRELVTTRPFSFTAYKAYKLCPQQYLLNSLLRFPTTIEPRLVYGSVLHTALELFYKKYKNRQKLPKLPELLGFVDQAIRSVEEFSGRNAIIRQAKELLTAYYQRLEFPHIPVGVEYSLTNHHVLLEDIWLTGKFDRLDPIDPVARTVRIVDYKTGAQAKTRNDIEGKTKSSDGALRQQLVFYSLLASLDRHFPYQATEFALLFLDDDHTFRQETFSVTADERDELAKDIIATYQEILTRTDFVHEREEFDRGCEVCELFRELQ